MKRTHSHADRPNAPTDEIDVDTKAPPTAKQLQKVIDAARNQRKAENKVNRLEGELSAAKKDLTLLQTRTVPTVMADAGLDEAPLGKGWSIKLQKIVTASVPAPDSDRVENAVERNAMGVAVLRKVAPDLLKNQIQINFGLEDEKFFQRFMRDLNKRKKGVDYVVRTTVHSGTLGKYVRDQDKLGKAVDEAALNVHRITRSELVGPKKSKDKI